jgi:hypothetical protein
VKQWTDTCNILNGHIKKNSKNLVLQAVFRIRMFLDLPDLEPKFICKDPDPDPSITKQKNEEKP